MKDFGLTVRQVIKVLNTSALMPLLRRLVMLIAQSVTQKNVAIQANVCGLKSLENV